MRAGHRHAARQEWEEAAEQYAAAAAIRPTWAHPYLYLARVRAALGDRAGALQAAVQARQLAVGEPAVHLLAGVVFLDIGEHTLAAEALGEAARLSPGNDLARAYLALLRWRRGEAEAALAELSQQPLPDSVAFLARLLLLTETEFQRRTHEMQPVVTLNRPRVPTVLARAVRVLHSSRARRLP